MLRDLDARPQVGDAALYQTLAAENASRGALDRGALVDAWLSADRAVYRGGELAVRARLGEGQVGVGRALAEAAFADAHLSDDERAALDEMVSQRTGRRAPVANVLPRLGPQQALPVSLFAGAPSDAVRTWMLAHADDAVVDVDAACAVLALLPATGDGRDWARTLQRSAHVFDAPLADDALALLRDFSSRV